MGQRAYCRQPILHWLIIDIINVVVAIINKTANNGSKYSRWFRLSSISVCLFSEGRSLLKLLPAAKKLFWTTSSITLTTLSRSSSSPDTLWKCQICLLWRAPVFNNILIFQANTWQDFRFCQWVLAAWKKKRRFMGCAGGWRGGHQACKKHTLWF